MILHDSALGFLLCTTGLHPVLTFEVGLLAPGFEGVPLFLCQLQVSRGIVDCCYDFDYMSKRTFAIHV